MGLARPDLRPDPSLSRAEMEGLQRDIAAAATFEDDHGPDPAAVAVEEATSLADGLPPARDGAQERLGTGDEGSADTTPDPDGPTVVGVDQAFLTDRDGDRPDAAVSAAVAFRDGTVVEYAHATTPLSIPYVPGLLAFREGEPILAALDALDAAPDLLVCDGSGRIHFREAGLATHVGVLRGRPERRRREKSPLRRARRVDERAPGRLADAGPRRRRGDDRRAGDRHRPRVPVAPVPEQQAGEPAVRQPGPPRVGGDRGRVRRGALRGVQAPRADAARGRVRRYGEAGRGLRRGRRRRARGASARRRFRATDCHRQAVFRRSTANANAWETTTRKVRCPPRSSGR
uniref:Endonuclease V n=1 Tax=Halorubrum sp. TP009 TaxID=447099 RepID=A7U0X2_9EURY|nr:endonuclease V [Halorubrum sp. TP009]